MPPTPVTAAGWRIEPPVSVPVAPRQRLAATAAAEPPEDPPGTSLVSAPLRRHGDTTGPECEVSCADPRPNASLLSLPSITAPSRHRLAGGDGRWPRLSSAEVRVRGVVRAPSVANRSL